MKRITQIDMFKRKECSKCWRVLPFDAFVKDPRKKRGVTSSCKECRKAASAKWAKANPHKIREYNARLLGKEQRREWYKKNKDKVAQHRYNYRRRPEVKAAASARQRKYRRTDPQHKLRSNARSRINGALRGRRDASVEKLLGCSIEFFQKYLESKFQNGMSWDNYGRGGWNVDHIIPCASFDLTDPEQAKACFHYSNCQPLWERENMSKGARVG